MKEVVGWWFTKDHKLPNEDGRKISIGKTHVVKGEIIPCQNGLHLSKRIVDALQYAPGNIIYKVKGHGVIVPNGNPVDKYACSHRTYLKGGIDIEDILYKYARLCALDVIDLWDAPDVVVEFLKTGEKTILNDAVAEAVAAAARWTKYAARAAAWAARAAGAAGAATATWAAAAAAAAAEAVAEYAAASLSEWATSQATSTATWAAAEKKQNKRLHEMVTRRLK